MSKSKQFEEIPDDLKNEMLMLVETFSKNELINKLRSLRESPSRSPQKSLHASGIVVESTMSGDFKSQPITSERVEPQNIIALVSSNNPEQSNCGVSEMNQQQSSEIDHFRMNNLLNNLKVSDYESIISDSSFNPVVVLQKIDLTNVNSKTFLSEIPIIQPQRNVKKEMNKNEKLTLANNMQTKALMKNVDDSSSEQAAVKLLDGSARQEDNKEQFGSDMTNKLSENVTSTIYGDQLSSKRCLRKRKNELDFEEKTKKQTLDYNDVNTDRQVSLDAKIDIHARSKSLRTLRNESTLKKNLSFEKKCNKEEKSKQNAKRVKRAEVKSCENSDEQHAEAYSKLSKICSLQGLNLDDIFRRKEMCEMIEKYKTNTEAIVFIGSHKSRSTGAVEPVIHVHKSKKILLETLAAIQVKNGDKVNK